MRIGIPKEIKDQEYRVALMPEGVTECIEHGHEVALVHQAGLGVGATDQDYIQAGAKIFKTAEELYAWAELIVKVKEPQKEEIPLLRPAQRLFSYLHLAPDKAATQDLMDRQVTAIAFETVTDVSGMSTPLLAPMSRIAGRLAPLQGTRFLQKDAMTGPHGRGQLIMGVPGEPAARVVVIGGGVVGENAIQVAIGLGAQVTVFDRSAERLETLAHLFPSLQTSFSNQHRLSLALKDADLVIGAIHVPGAITGRLVTRTMIADMPKGSVIVDVCIDQGGCFETSRATTHSAPTYIEEGVVHYCVANMPGIVPLTASHALTHAILPYVLTIADQGVEKAITNNPGLAQGLNLYHGLLTNEKIATAQQRSYQEPLVAVAKVKDA